MGSRSHRKVAAATALLAVLLTAACSHNPVNTQPVPTASTTPSQAQTSTPEPTSTIDPRAKDAVTAYEAFTDTANNAQRHPVGHDQEWPAGADFTKVSFDPIRAQFMEYIWSLKAQGVQYRGTPDTPHISVKSVRLDAEPWPTVMLTDCQTGGDWDEYVIKTGKRVPDAGNGTISPPYLITAKVIRFQGKWGVQSTTADKSRTCTA